MMDGDFTVDTVLIVSTVGGQKRSNLFQNLGRAGSDTALCGSSATLVPLRFSHRVCQVGVSEVPVVEVIDWHSDDAALRHLLSVQVRGIFGRSCCANATPRLLPASVRFAHGFYCGALGCV